MELRTAVDMLMVSIVTDSFLWRELRNCETMPLRTFLSRLGWFFYISFCLSLLCSVRQDCFDLISWDGCTGVLSEQLKPACTILGQHGFRSPRRPTPSPDSKVWIRSDPLWPGPLWPKYFNLDKSKSPPLDQRVQGSNKLRKVTHHKQHNYQEGQVPCVPDC